jgi:GGDEF domain-containing protein
VSWVWLNALARDLPVAAAVTDGPGHLAFATSATSATTDRLNRASESAAFQTAVREVLERHESRRLSLDRVDILIAPAAAAGIQAAVAVAVDQGFSTWADRLLDGLAAAIRVQLTQSTEEDLEAFDRVASLHRLLHEAVDRGSERDVVTAFAEAIIAWDGVEVSGYVQDIDGQWTLQVSAPGARRGLERAGSLDTRARAGTIAPLTADEAAHFGFDRSRPLLGATIGTAAVDPWFLIFAEGFGPVRESSTRLYIDLLREVLNRTAAIAETRVSWAILQQLLGAAEPETAAAAALSELSRALPADGASLAVTAPTGAVVLSAGDDEPQGSVRPFGRVNRLVSNLKLADGYTLDLTARRSPGDTFARREQLMLDRLTGVFGAWVSRALKQGTVQKERRAERRDFDQVLDRAAAQAVRDGSDVSVMVISVPETAARPAVLRSWVVELRSRMRGSDLAGSLSDREIGLLLCGTTPDNVDYVSARLTKHLKFGERGNPIGTIGIASRAAGQTSEASLVQLARRNLTRRVAADGGAR